MFFDFHIGNHPELAVDAGKMGYSGVVLTACSRDCIDHPETLKNLRESADNLKTEGKTLKGETKLPTIHIGVEIEAKNQVDLKKKKSRNSAKRPT